MFLSTQNRFNKFRINNFHVFLKPYQHNSKKENKRKNMMLSQVWFNSSCFLLYVLNLVVQTFTTYVLPFVSSSSNTAEETSSTLLAATSMITTLPTDEHHESISVRGSWKIAHTTLTFDETGLITRSLHWWVPYLLSMFPFYPPGQLLLVTDRTPPVPLTSVSHPLPKQCTRLFVIYNMNPILFLFVQPALSVCLE